MSGKRVLPERPVSFSAEQIARSDGAIRVGYRDGRPFIPVADDTVPTPYLERLQARFAASLLEEEITSLPRGFEDIRDMMIAAGGPRPTFRCLVGKVRAQTAARQLAYRTAKPAKAREQLAQWRASNPDKVRAQKRLERDAHYFRPFVAIDSEGRNYPGEDDIFVDEPSGRVLYEKHETYLWGAAADDGREPEWLTAQGYSPSDKRPLTIYEILDWLLSLPETFGDAIFVSFSFGYDVTQILKSLPFKTVWEICKRERYATKKEDRKPIGSSPVYWGEYAFEYIKGKWFKIYHIRDRETNVRTR